MSQYFATRPEGLHYVIRLAGLRGRISERDGTEEAGYAEWLAEYDAEAHEGRGFVRWTYDPAEALTFPTATDAAMFYMTVPSLLPKRPDGLPNRPLTAFNVEIVPVLP